MVIEYFRSGGPGGQHRNVTESAVRVRHPPSGVSVVAAESRSQHRNRETAFERLIARLERLNRIPKTRIPVRISKRAVERRLAEKKRRQSLKQLRRATRNQDE